MGHVRFLVFYLACAAAGAAVHALVMPTSDGPLIGASGAVSGVVAAYVLLPSQGPVWVLVLWRIPLPLPAALPLAFWIGQQFYFLVADTEGRVSFAAHVGGILAGAILVVILKRRTVPLFDRSSSVRRRFITWKARSGAMSSPPMPASPIRQHRPSPGTNGGGHRREPGPMAAKNRQRRQFAPFQALKSRQKSVSMSRYDYRDRAQMCKVWRALRTGKVPMKILVTVKRVVDYNVKIRVKPDGSGVELANVKMSMNPSTKSPSRKRCGSRKPARPRKLSSFPSDLPRPRKRCARRWRWGADRAILVETDAEVEPLAVAKIVKGVVAEENPGLVIVGKQAIDDDSNQTGQMLSPFWAGRRAPSPPRSRSATARPRSPRS